MQRKLKIISGGQTGVDQAALRAAREAGLPTGGWMPRGWRTETGPAPWLEGFGLCEMPGDDYPSRTRKNAVVSDATLWLGDSSSSGGRLTCATALQASKPLYVADSFSDIELAAIADWLATRRDLQILNVAGDRESSSPGIGGKAEQFLRQLFCLLQRG